ncbi:malate dehydrogenase [Nocardia carnea]|uniref:malate dehydrogenase n=1 Tax=Nocardia carnea TaxID=37328 RepID=UPI0024574AD3|nr:malate dehydrogenase [Nocardia carnea]
MIIGGAGGIGSSVAYSLALNGTGDELVLVDRNVDALQTHVWDLEQLRISARPFCIRAGTIADAADADIVVLSAAAPPRKDSPRIEYLSENLAIARETGQALAATPGWPGVLIVASNPVDPLVTALQRLTGIDRRRVLGYTVNDSLRLRYGIAEALGVQPHRVSAWVLGEHGDHCVPLFDRVQIDGEAVVLDEGQQRAARAYLLEWYPRWVALGVPRTSTWTSGNGISSMVRAVASDSGEIWPASIVLAGEYGIDDTAVGVPVRLTRTGAAEVLDWRLRERDRKAMQEAAGYVDEALAQVGAPQRR